MAKTVRVNCPIDLQTHPDNINMKISGQVNNTKFKFTVSGVEQASTGRTFIQIGPLPEFDFSHTLFGMISLVGLEDDAAQGKDVENLFIGHSFTYHRTIESHDGKVIIKQNSTMSHEGDIFKAYHSINGACNISPVTTVEPLNSIFFQTGTYSLFGEFTMLGHCEDNTTISLHFSTWYQLNREVPNNYCAQKFIIVKPLYDKEAKIIYLFQFSVVYKHLPLDFLFESDEKVLLLQSGLTECFHKH
jgi:hypothetical protein